MSDFLQYLFSLSQAPRDSRYDAFTQALKAFDSGITPMFIFSDEDMEYSRVNGALPEGAEPESMLLKFAPLSSRTGGQFGPPWYIAQKLREVAKQLEERGLDEFERWLEHERMEGDGIARLERTLPDAEARLDNIKQVMADYDQLFADGKTPDDESLNGIVRRCIDLGVNLPICETPNEFADMLQRLPELIHDEMQRTAARIQRTREQMAQAGGDPDGFSDEGAPAEQ